jgi:hypothetical protein
MHQSLNNAKMPRKMILLSLMSSSCQIVKCKCQFSSLPQISCRHLAHPKDQRIAWEGHLVLPIRINPQINIYSWETREQWVREIAKWARMKEILNAHHFSIRCLNLWDNKSWWQCKVLLRLLKRVRNLNSQEVNKKGSSWMVNRIRMRTLTTWWDQSANKTRRIYLQ